MAIKYANKLRFMARLERQNNLNKVVFINELPKESDQGETIEIFALQEFKFKLHYKSPK